MGLILLSELHCCSGQMHFESEKKTSRVLMDEKLCHLITEGAEEEENSFKKGLRARFLELGAECSVEWKENPF